MADEGTQKMFLLFLSNNEVFVWDKDTVLTLRRDYRIVGSLIGSLPSKPKQNLVFSLPLVLQAEEVNLLLEKNIAKLVASDDAYSLPSNHSIKMFQEERKANINEQIVKLKEIKKTKLEEFAEVIEEARERKQEKIQNRKRKKKLSSCEKDTKKQRYTEDSEHGNVDDIQVDEKTRVVDNESCLLNLNKCKERINENIFTLSENNTQDDLQDSSKKHEIEEKLEHGHKGCGKIVHEKRTKNTSSENDIQVNFQDSTLVCVPFQHPSSLLRIREAMWTFPETELEKLRYKVFLDLWEKGYYITQGSKFGGDYLVYPGDPFRFHSYFVVKIVAWKKSISALDLISVGRLGSTVKKTSVLASVDSSGNVIYTSIQWPGFT